MRRVSRSIFAIAMAASMLAACSDSPTENVDQMTITDTQVGTGAEAVNGKTVHVHYTGWLYKESASNHHGEQFDSSRDGGPPLPFVLGTGSVIKGWDQGILGMKVGGKRTLIIPAELAYGSRGAGGVIPPNAALVFDVELMAVN
jgi:FKBP-type peptidyl-prolyl cis-trans isomerase FkpA